ncbi:MAG TPA: HAD hydrolase family protein [Kiritimatiellia bacterium]|nr:HAD hydrolase family protein [Kiritimatiellia bacterium]HMO97631.1 HAD hydrolase family protein [Kiritimatiellia bacterium]HMP95991.1 HAD hydrolase family protein [Kiritimatiellia bacterium]
MNWSAEQRAARVRALILDVDGVLTDGGLLYHANGESKIFNVRDGHGIVLARLAGLRTAFLTGRASEAVRRRAAELKIDALREGVYRKGEALDELLRALDVQPEHVCYAGDDLVDLAVLRRVGFPAAPADAVPEVRDAAAWVATRPGGNGAVRELVEFILKSQGVWADIVRRHEREQYP